MEYKGKTLKPIDKPITSLTESWTPYLKQRVEDFIKANLPHDYYEDEWDEMTPDQQQSIIDSGDFIVILEGSRPTPPPPVPPTPSVLAFKDGRLSVSGTSVDGTARIVGTVIDGKLIL